MRRGAEPDHAHERALLFGIGLLIVLGTVPIFAHHLPLPGLDTLGSVERIGAICLVALHLTLAPVHGAIHVLLAAGAAYAVFDGVRGAWRLHRGLAALDLAPPQDGSRIATIAAQVGVPPDRVLVASSPANPAFTYGSLRPRVCVSESLAARLGDAQLRAVLAHEWWHARRRDPLRLSLLRFVALTLFWIPALRRISEDVAVEFEFDADTVGAAGEPLIMAAALLEAAKERDSIRFALSAALVGDEMLAARVRRLAGEQVSHPSRLTRRTLAGAVAALGVVWLSGAVVAHPLHGATGEATCLRHSGWPLSHLFCSHHVSGAEPCPHRVPEATAERPAHH